MEFNIHLYTFHYNITVIISEFLLSRKKPHQMTLRDLSIIGHFLTSVKTRAIKFNACVKNLLFYFSFPVSYGERVQSGHKAIFTASSILSCPTKQYK